MAIIYGTSGNDNGVQPFWPWETYRPSLRGTNNADSIYGRGGDDVIRGLDGDDKLYGEDGNDEVYGDLGNDSLYGGNGNDTLTGGSGSDRLYGGAGSDRISGGSGNDYINGGGAEWGGFDFLTGEEGRDVFDLRNGGKPTIYDWNYGGDQDSLYLNGSLYDYEFKAVSTGMIRVELAGTLFDNHVADIFVHNTGRTAAQMINNVIANTSFF